MAFCHSCFNDDFLKALIRREGETGECDLCGGTRKRCFDTDRMRELLEPMLLLYSGVEEYMPPEPMKEMAGLHPTRAEKLVDDWELFDSEEEARAFLSACREPYHPKHNPDGDAFFDPDAPVGEEEIFYTGEYAESQYWSECWDKLRYEIIHENRFFAGHQRAEELAKQLAYAEVEVGGLSLYRARLGVSDKCLPKSKMGSPPPDLATAGRANPLGIPYLYLASDELTAVSELRPQRGDSATIARFYVRGPLRLVDLRGPRVGSPFRWGDRLKSVVGIMEFLESLSSELSRPVGQAFRSREYLPTQYLCELIKKGGFDGIAYKSGLAEGYNIALFDPTAARCREVRSVNVEKVEITLR